VSKTPAIPNTFLESTLAERYAQYVITSKGLETMMIFAFGEYFTTFSVTDFTIPAFVAIKSSRDIPGFLGKPDVITTTSELAVFE